VEVACAPIVVEDSMLGAVITFRDVTRRNALERELERSERMASLGQLAATIAHEFNNVMMGILPFIEVLIRRLEEDDALRPMAVHIKRALGRGKQITSEVLKFAHPSEPALQPLLLSDLLQSAMPDLRAVAGPQVEIVVGPVDDAAAAALDRSLMQQVLSNLVANARDALAGNGSIRIEYALADEDADLRRAPQADPGAYVRLSVHDDGAGIDEATQRRMFEPLFTTKKAGGTGLGLAVVQQVMSRHRGIVVAESAPGSGTTFHLYLRRVQPPAAQIANAPHPPRGPVRSLLLVEDDESVAAGLRAILELEGMTLRVVTRGLEAVPAIEEARPDAVLLDRGLPDVDGVEVCRAILARWPDLPIIFSTGHGNRADLGEMLERPNIGHVLKPYDFHTLAAILEQVVPPRKPSAQDDGAA
jgi:two-component system cell cycle sensor histidine kinase/response regulator CckA